ncbi:Ankyrin repeat domain-containing protein 50 [Histomonas meleagridis]|nr:Ankyrin repeat domain-containing protein 50 [Histomonas meleagridis]
MLVRPSKFIFTILKLLRGIFKAYPEDPLHNGFAGIKDDISFVMTQRLLNFFSNYFVVDQSTTYKWGTISKVINTNNIRNPTVLQDSYFEVTIASCLACWKTFPSDIVDRFLFTLNSFQSHGKPQNPTYFGTVVYSHYVSVNGLRCTLILTRGFLHLMNFAPKKSDTHEIIPESYGFICSNTKPLFFGAPINSIRFTQFRPKSTIGIVSSPKGYFAVDFLQIEALTDFWLMFIITQLEQSLPFIEPPFPDLRFQISFAHDPVFGSLFCSNVKAGDNKWIISMPFSKFTQKIVKIFKRCSKLQTLIPLDAPLPEINECLKSENSVKFLNREYTYLNIAQASKPPSYDDFNVLQCEYMHSACMELAYTRNQNDQFKFFKILGITDFNRSFVNHSLSLFQYQAKNFPSMISACRIQASPLLHFASLFFDDLKMLKMVTDNFDINDTDDDHRTALFYAIRNPSLCVIQNLFEHKIDADKGDYTSETPLISSFENGYSDISEFLIQQGASINRTHLEFHEPSLFYALQNRKSKTFKKLLKHCKTSDLNCPNSKGQFLTHVCIETRQCKPLFLLSAACADIDPNNYTDKYQHPLHYFLDCKLTKEVKLFRALLSLPNLDLNVYDRHGQTPLCRCISMKATKLLPLLVSDPRCDLDMQNSKGISPLSIAVKKKRAIKQSHVF